MLENLVLDVKLGARSLFRDKGFTAMVLLTLAICMAAYTATFAIVNSVLLRPLPIPNADRIVLMANLYPKAGVTDQDDSAVPDYYDRRRVVTALQEQAMFDAANMTLQVNGRAEQVPGLEVTPSFFSLIGVAPARGRAFTAEEGEIGHDREVIISHALWQQLYGGDPAAVGRELRFYGIPFTIVGIMPPNFVFLYPEVRYWVPLAFTAESKTRYHSNCCEDIGRLKPGATTAQVQAQVDALNAANLDRLPEVRSFIINSGFYTKVEPLQHMLVKKVEGPLFLLWGGALFVLLIGGLNIANLALARWSARSKEIATRLALGASRAQLSRQLIVENVLVAGAGGILGLLLGTALLRAVAAIGLERFPRAEEVRIDPTVILVGLGLAAAAGVLVGLVPLAGAFKLNLITTLREGGRTGTGGARTRRWRQGLVGAEIGLAFVLLAGAGLLLASFRRLLEGRSGLHNSGSGLGVYRRAAILPHGRGLAEPYDPGARFDTAAAGCGCCRRHHFHPLWQQIRRQRDYTRGLRHEAGRILHRAVRAHRHARLFPNDEDRADTRALLRRSRHRKRPHSGYCRRTIGPALLAESRSHRTADVHISESAGP